MKVTQHDVSYLVSAGLLVVATVTATTGLVSDLWDLNEFVYHKYAGYALAALSLAHVYLRWGRLVGYARWRLGRRPARRRLAVDPSAVLRPCTASGELSVPSAGVRQAPPDGSGRGPSARAQAEGSVELRPALATAKRTTQQQPAGPAGEGEQARWPAGSGALRAPLPRRGFVGLVLGGLGGFALGRGLRPQPALPYGVDMGAVYHEWSKPRWLSLLGTVANWGRQPALYKEYAWAEQIPLPPPGDFRGLYTEEAIQRRRSVRDYAGQAMALEELSRLLYYTGGINAKHWGHRLRAAPSAGALYPIEIYSVVHRVEGLEPGLYHYAVRDHALEQLQAGDLRGEVVRHGLMQEFLGQANLVLVLTAIFQRLRWKYRERSYRYALLEAGHLGQNVYLAATSMGMGACAVGAFLDDDLNAMLGVDGQHEAAIYMLAVGKV